MLPLVYIGVFKTALMARAARHEICPKFYTAGFSGQKFYTLKFAEFQQLW